MSMGTKKLANDVGRLRPISLWPLTPEEAISRAFQAPHLNGTPPKPAKTKKEFARTKASKRAKQSNWHRRGRNTGPAGLLW